MQYTNIKMDILKTVSWRAKKWMAYGNVTLSLSIKARMLKNRGSVICVLIFLLERKVIKEIK